MSPLLELAGATVRRHGIEVLHDARLRVQAGELVGVVGPNGAGKTTLLRAALGLVHLTSGEARLAGAAVARLSPPELAAKVGYLPQERRISWNLPAWRLASLGAPHVPGAEARRRAHLSLERVGLGSLADRGVLDMSGGERARVLLARLFVTQAPVLVADEPAAGLDPDAQLLTLDLFRQEAARGAGVLLTLHDLSLAARTCDRLLVVSRGRVVADGPPRDALARERLREVFGLDGGLEESSAGLVVAAVRAAQDG